MDTALNSRIKALIRDSAVTTVTPKFYGVIWTKKSRFSRLDQDGQNVTLFRHKLDFYLYHTPFNIKGTRNCLSGRFRPNKGRPKHRLETQQDIYSKNSAAYLHSSCDFHLDLFSEINSTSKLTINQKQHDF